MGTPVQEKRHEAKAAVREAYGALEGRPGLSKDEQLARLDSAVQALESGKVATLEARAIVEARDDEAYKAEKAAKAESFTVVGEGSVSVLDDEEDDDSGV